MGKNVLIIGASGDIGTSIAKRLARDGWQLMLHYNQNKQAMETNRLRLNNESILMEIQAGFSGRWHCFCRWQSTFRIISGYG
jgi:3-oxoacyl-[acyl-carrier protein] reductase